MKKNGEKTMYRTFTGYSYSVMGANLEKRVFEEHYFYNEKDLSIGTTEKDLLKPFTTEYFIPVEITWREELSQTVKMKEIDFYNYSKECVLGKAYTNSVTKTFTVNTVFVYGADMKAKEFCEKSYQIFGKYETEDELKKAISELAINDDFMVSEVLGKESYETKRYMTNKEFITLGETE